MTKKLDDTAKIVVLKKDIPFREGTAVYKRARAVLSSKTVQEALKRGARTSTVRWFVAAKQIRLGGTPPKANKAVAA